MKSRRFCCLVVLVVALTLVSPLGASTFMAMDTVELVKASSSVVEGEVLSVSSFWDPEGRVILTEATLFIRDRLHGEAPAMVKIKTFGGEVDGYTVEAIGFPKFAQGERVLLFLQQDQRDRELLRVTGYQQGHYRIVTGRDGMDWAVPTVDSGSHLVTRRGMTATAPLALPLAELRQVVRSTAEMIERAAAPAN